VYYEKKSMLGVAVKNYRATLQREIGDWENKHMGPRWANILKVWPQLSVKIKACKEELEEFSDGFEDRLVAPHIGFLKALGFVAEDGDALTEKGRCATEVNEAHPILVTEAYFRGWLDDLDSEDLIGFLGAFASDGSDADESPGLSSLRISSELRNVFSNLQNLTGDCYDEERRRAIITSGYWDISTFWVEPAIAWIKNGSVAQVCTDYAIFEGNLYKFVMSLSNMIDELSAVATLQSDVAMLEKLVAVKNLVMAPGKMSWGESLYLRL
jgi:superfamily II RNA helicase